MIRIRDRALFPILLASLLVLHAALASPFWPWLARAFASDGLSYEQRRVAHAFGGVPVDRIGARLSVVLAPPERIALGDGILKDDFLEQRLTEGLYPRVIDKTASAVLELASGSSFAPSSGTELLRLPDGRVLFLSRDGAAAQPSTSVPPAMFAYDWSGTLPLILSVLGFGFAALFALRRLYPGAFDFDPLTLLSSAVLSGALLIGISYSLFEWLGVSVPFPATFYFGSALLGVAACRVAWARRGRLAPVLAVPADGGLAAALKRPENYVFAALLLLFFLGVAEFPVTLWDGRSIWFFHAKQIFLNGGFSRADLVHPDAHWSQPSYPILLPAWLAHFSSLSAQYNERMASVGVPVLFGAILALVWRLARLQAGRWGGAALALCLFFSLESLSAGGYAEGYVASLLLVQFLALCSPRHRALAWLSAASVALIKQEGLVFSALIAIGYVAFHPEARSRTMWRRLAPLICYLPAVLHQLFAAALGLRGDFAGIRCAGVLGDAPRRLGVIFDGALSLMPKYPLLWEGAVAAVVASGFWLARRRAGRAPAKAAAVLGVAFFAFSCAVLFVTPLDLYWHVHAALARLMLHSGAFLLLSAFLFAGERLQVPGPSRAKDVPWKFSRSGRSR